MVRRVMSESRMVVGARNGGVVVCEVEGGASLERMEFARKGNELERVLGIGEKPGLGARVAKGLGGVWGERSACRILLFSVSRTLITHLLAMPHKIYRIRVRDNYSELSTN